MRRVTGKGRESTMSNGGTTVNQLGELEGTDSDDRGAGVSGMTGWQESQG